LKVTNEKTENNQAFLNIEMEPAEVEESLEKSYHRLVKKTNIPGFRKGKAPRDILERYIDREALFEDALNSLIPQACEKAIKEQEIEAFATPSIEIAQTDPVIFKATVPLSPTVKLGDYHHIQVTPEPVELTGDDVDAAMEQLRHQQATWQPVERPVDLNDLVFLDIESNIEDKPFINQKGVQYQVLPDSANPVPGFAEQLQGMKRDEEKEFKLQISLDYPESELAGKETSFKVRVTEIKQEILSELNDEFARGINADFKTLDSLRERVSTNLKLGAEEKARIDFEERIVEQVVNLAQVEFPPILVEMETNRLINHQMSRWQRGDKGLEEYLKSINKSEQQLREELHPLAIKRTTGALVLGKIAKEEKIEVSDAETDTEIENMTKSATDNKDALEKVLNTPQARESIGQTLIARKIIQRLVEIAKDSSMNIKATQKEGEK